MQNELVEWQRRQQKACIGAPDDVCLDQLENWYVPLCMLHFALIDFNNHFSLITCVNVVSCLYVSIPFCRFTCVAVCLFQVREFLSKLEELVGKVSYDNDPVKAQRPALQKRADTLLKDLLKKSVCKKQTLLKFLCKIFL